MTDSTTEEGADLLAAFGFQKRAYGEDSSKVERVRGKQKKVSKSRKQRDRTSAAKDVTITFRTYKSTKSAIAKLQKSLGYGSATDLLEALVMEAAKSEGIVDADDS